MIWGTGVCSRFRFGSAPRKVGGVAEFTLVITIFCLAVACGFLALWLLYGRWDHARFESERRRTTFHCVRCDHVYALTGEHAAGSCPRCGHGNNRLRF